MSASIQFTVLRELEHWAVSVAIERKIARLVRTEAPHRSVTEVQQSFADVARIVGKFPTRSWGLVQDMRATRPAGTLEIERAIRKNRQEVTALFARHAILFRTAAGMMQAKRMLREVPEPKIELFLDEADAFAWALGE